MPVTAESTNLSANDISVVVFCYNFENYIAECLESLVTQTVLPKEIIVCDDCSIDSSWEIIEAYQNKYPELIRSYRHAKNIGMPENSNFALNKAEGTLITWMDGDDRFLPEKLETEFRYLAKNPNCRLAYSNVRTINGIGEPTGVWHDGKAPFPPSGDTFLRVFSKNFFPANHNLFRNPLVYRSVLNHTGLVDTGLNILIDYDLKIKLSHSCRFVYTNTVLTEYRLHANGIHNSPAILQHDDIYNIFEKHAPKLHAYAESDRNKVISTIGNILSQINPGTDHCRSLQTVAVNSHPEDVNTYPERTNLPRSNIDDRNLIFLISLPRSGSTLLQRILSGNSQIHSTGEPWLMLHPLHAFKTDSINTKYDQNLAATAAKDFLSQMPEKMDLYYKAVRAYGLTFYQRALELSGKRYFLDKTPRYYTIIPELSKTFPNARFILLLRNPLAVLSSVLQTWCNNDPEILRTTSNYRDLVQGPKALIDGIKTLGANSSVVYYEELAVNPQACLRDICHYLDIPYHEEMIEYGRREAPKGKFGDTVGITQHQRPVSKSMNKWFLNFSDESLRAFATDYAYQIGSRTFSELGYDFSAIESALNDLFEGKDSSSLTVAREDTSETFLLSTKNSILEDYEQLIASLEHENSETIVTGILGFIAEHPVFPQAHNDLGVLYGMMNLPEKAFDHYRKAVSLDDRNVTFQKNLADFLFIVRNDIQSALAIYTRLLAYNPKDVETLYALGQISLKLGIVEDAQTFLGRILEISPGHISATQALDQIAIERSDDKRSEIIQRSARLKKKHQTGSIRQTPRTNPKTDDETVARCINKEILVATSIAPHDIENQKVALQSWFELGFEVVSLNSPGEIDVLKNHFPAVSFHAVDRNSKNLFGKPFVYFDDFIAYFKTIDRAVYGIVNSDIHLRASKAIGSFLKNETVGSLIYGSRLDVPSIENLQGEFYRNGFDFFFFDRSLLTIYPESIVSIGVTWWDYWAVLIPALKSIKTKKIVTPFAYHVLHPNRWDAKQWNKVGRQISKYLQVEDIEKGQHSSPDVAWTVFLEILQNCAAVKCLDKAFPDITRRRFVYSDIFSLNVCILDFLDRISIETMLPWDESTYCQVYRSKGPNFFPNFLDRNTENDRPTVASEVLQNCTRSYKKALILYRDNNSDAAETILKEITTTLPGNLQASNLLGVILWERGSKETALQYFNAALHHDPHDRPTVINCATAMIHFGKPKEARQLFAAYLRFNPGDLEVGRWQRKLEAKDIPSLPLQFCLHSNQDFQELPVLVYQMGKVGSTSIIDSIEQYGIPTKHAHTLSWPGIKHAEELFSQNQGGVLPVWLRQYRGIRTEIDRLGKTGRWKIITLVRDPLRRYVSELFQNLDRYFPDLRDFENCDTGVIRDHIQQYLTDFDEKKDHACCWFDNELKSVFDIDVFSVPFNANLGFQRYHTDRADLLLLRLENLSSIASVALEPFLSINPFKLSDSNISESKPYANLYKRVLSDLVIDRSLLDRFYSNRLATHFYSDSEIETFKEQWMVLRSPTAPPPPSNRFRVSAVVSTYRAERFIEGRLQNLVDQTLFTKGDLEIIVVDSNSPENERTIVKRFAAKYPHIVYLRTPERETVYAAWNRGIDMARGTYFVNANTDDRFATDALEAMADKLDAQPDVDAVYGDWVVTQTPNDTLDSKTPKRFFGYPEFHPGLLFYLQVTSHANFIRRSVFKITGPFDGSYTVFGDREFMLRFSANGFRAVKLQKTVGLYLENPTSIERANKNLGAQEWSSLYDHYLEQECFAGLMGQDPDISVESLSNVYTEVGCFGMNLYHIDDKFMHVLGSPTRFFAKAIELNHENVVALNNMGVIAQHREATQDALNFFTNARFLAKNSHLRIVDNNQKLTRQGISDPYQLKFILPEGFKPAKIIESEYNPHYGHRPIATTAHSIVRQDNNAKKHIPKKKIRKRKIDSTSKEKKQTTLSRQPINRSGINVIEPSWTHYLREDYSSASNTLQAAIAAKPDHWEAYRLLVDVMLQAGQETCIADQLRPLEYRSGSPVWVLALIGNGYEAAGDLFRANQFADQTLEMDQNCARGWNLKGVIEYRNGNPGTAARHFTKASDCDSSWGDPWTNLGTIFWEQGDFDKALDCFEKGFNFSPVAPNVATTYHIAISETGQYERAKPVFEEVVKCYPDFRKARFLLIDILIHIEAYPDAMHQVESVLARFGADPQLLVAAKAIRSKIGAMTVRNKKHPSLSLCMIVKNEEKYLARCLESLKPIVDEMIIVDTGSSDATRDIAEIFGAKVFDFEWKDDFSAARNFSLEQASGDWILIMDADEVIATKDHKNILKFLKKWGSTHRAAMIVTRNYTNQYNLIGWVPNAGQYPDEEEGTGWIPSEKVRLFPNDDDIRFEYPVHEVVGPALSRKNIPVKSFPSPVHHYGKMDRNNNRQKDEHYYKIGMDKLSISPNDPVAIREMAVQAAKLDKNEDSISLWKRFIDLQPHEPQSYINLASCHGKLKQYPKARDAAHMAIKMAPDAKEAHLNLGLSELHLGDTSKAEGIFQRLVQKNRNYHSAVFLLGTAQLCDGKIEKGIKTLKSLSDVAIWDNLSYSLQEIVESLIAADWQALALNLIKGAQKINCSNETLDDYGKQLESRTIDGNSHIAASTIPSIDMNCTNTIASEALQ